MNDAQHTSRLGSAKTARKRNKLLKAQRLKWNWTQVYVATRIGTSDVEVSRWENGAAQPTLYFREKLCALFHATPEALGFLASSETTPEKRIPHPVTFFPRPLTSLIGREVEVAAINSLLHLTETRLLTLTGTGGVGKTHLALHSANALQASFADGACFVSLAPLRDAAQVLPTLAQALRLQGREMHSPLELLKVFLHDKDLLLVLDNFEHVVAAAPQLVELLAVCPRLKMLATSREGLRVRGEHELAIQPLTLPDPRESSSYEQLMQYGAVALFLARAREVIPDMALTPATSPLIVKICRRLDGLPLAIELAASQLKLFPLPALLERLEHRLRFLTGGPRDLPERQQTLRNTLQWSYDLLSQAEQQLFRTLSVFVGGCTLAALEFITNEALGRNMSISDGVMSLLSKHLLYQERLENGDMRLQMLETIREYGQECLSACGERKVTCRAHTKCYLRLVNEAEKQLLGEAQREWFERLAREQDNLRAALRRSLERASDDGQGEIALRLAASLVHFWTVRGSVSEGRTWLEQALARRTSGSQAAQVRVLSSASWIAFINGEVGKALERAEECLCMYSDARETMTVRDRSSALYWLSWFVMQQKNEEAVQFLLAEDRTLAREYGDPQPLAWVLFFLAQVPSAQGKYAEARSLLEESLALFRSQSNADEVAWVSLRLGSVLFTQNEEADALVLVENSLRHFREMQSKLGIISVLYLFGRLAFARDEMTRAQALFEEALQLLRVSGLQEHKAQILFQMACLAFVQGDSFTAGERLEESMILLLQTEHNEDVQFYLRQWGCLMARQGDMIWATQLWGTAEVFASASSRPNPFVPFFVRTATEREIYERAVGEARSILGEENFAQALAEGRSMALEQMLATQRQRLGLHVK